MSKEASVRRCQNPACNAPLVMMPGESTKRFNKRQHCDRECQWRKKHPAPEAKGIMSDKEQKEINRLDRAKRDKISQLPLAEVAPRLHPTVAWLFQ